MRIIDIQSVLQHARVAEQAQTQMQHAQEFAQSAFAREAQAARELLMGTVRDTKQLEGKIIEPDERQEKHSTGRQAGQRKRNEHAEASGETEEKKKVISEDGHVDIVI